MDRTWIPKLDELEEKSVDTRLQHIKRKSGTERKELTSTRVVSNLHLNHVSKVVGRSVPAMIKSIP